MAVVGQSFLVETSRDDLIIDQRVIEFSVVHDVLKQLFPAPRHLRNGTAIKDPIVVLTPELPICCDVVFDAIWKPHAVVRLPDAFAVVPWVPLAVVQAFAVVPWVPLVPQAPDDTPALRYSSTLLTSFGKFVELAERVETKNDYACNANWEIRHNFILGELTTDAVKRIMEGLAERIGYRLAHKG